MNYTRYDTMGTFEKTSQLPWKEPPFGAPKGSADSLLNAMMLRMQIQIQRVKLLQSLVPSITKDPTKGTLLGVQYLSDQLSNMHDTFVKEHEYLKENWPNDLISHSYFVKDYQQKEEMVMQDAHQKLLRLTKSFGTQNTQRDNLKCENEWKKNKYQSIAEQVSHLDSRHEGPWSFCRQITTLSIANRALPLIANPVGYKEEEENANQPSYAAITKTCTETPLTESPYSQGKAVTRWPSSPVQPGPAVIREDVRCRYCQEKHFILMCKRFNDLSVYQKFVFVDAQKLCHICFDLHPFSQCMSSKRCVTCGGPHHTVLHNPQQYRSNPYKFVKKSH